MKLNNEFKFTVNGGSDLDTETVIATGSNLIDALTDALLQIKQRENTNGNYLVIIKIIKDRGNNELQ